MYVNLGYLFESNEFTDRLSLATVTINSIYKKNIFSVLNFLQKYWYVKETTLLKIISNSIRNFLFFLKDWNASK